MSSSGPLDSNRGLRGLWHNRPFLLLWCGQALAQIGDKVFFVLLIALLSDYYSSTNVPTNTMRSALMIAATLPAIFLGSAAGILVDRVEKRRILTFCNYFRGILTLLLPLLPRAFFILLLIAFIESILTQFFAPAEQAAIPLLVRQDELMAANAFFTTTIMGSLIVGFAIGEPILSWAKGISQEAGQPILVGGLYVLSGVLLHLIPLKEPRLKQSQASPHLWSDFKAGLRYLKQNPLISSAMLQLTILYSVFAALTVLAVELAPKIGLKQTQFGFLLAAAGIGMVLGAAFLGRWGNHLRNRPLPLLGFIMMASVLALFAMTRNLWQCLGLTVILGLGAACIAIPMQTLIQQQTPEAMRGKVFGLQNNVVNIALSAPLAIAGPLTDWIGLQAVLLLTSAIVAVSGSWAWRKAHRSFL